MKKVILILGIVLIVAAAVCFGLSLFFHFLGGSVMDGSNEFYHNAYRRYLISRNCGIGLGIAGVICIVIRLIFFKK